MKNRAISSIPSPYVVITTLVYALFAALFFELDDSSGEDIDINNTDSDIKTSAQELVDTSCKPPCLLSSEMCITMWAEK